MVDSQEYIAKVHFPKKNNYKPILRCWPIPVPGYKCNITCRREDILPVVLRQTEHLGDNLASTLQAGNVQ